MLQSKGRETMPNFSWQEYQCIITKPDLVCDGGQSSETEHKINSTWKGIVK